MRIHREATRDAWYDATLPGGIQAVTVPYDGERGTYLTLAKRVLFFETFGASAFLPSFKED